MIVFQRIETLEKLIDLLGKELATRDLSQIPTEKLFEMRLRILELAREEF